LVVGLGNPGRRYTRSRHNIGVRVVERFAADCGFSLSDSQFSGRFGRGEVSATDAAAVRTPVAVLAPQTFMNRSGQSIAEALAELNIEDQATDLIVVLDDVDLPFGRLRIRARGSSGGHLGLANVIDCVGHGDFPRLRFGIGRPGEPTATTVDWVLQDFSDLEESALYPMAERAVEALATMALFGVTPAMNRYNRDPGSPDEPADDERQTADSGDKPES
jgi:PTH1 family peptidyl-tRNA hydrolase